MRIFDTGATRDNDEEKRDYEGFLSGPAIVAMGEYMHKHRHQPDGHLRPSDNWQKGIPLDAYMKSAFRHFIDVWQLHRGYIVVRPETKDTPSMVDSLCGLLFNIQVYLHEYLKDFDDLTVKE